MGHFIRTLSLAEMLKDDFICVFVTKLPSEYQRKEISKVFNEYIELPEDENHFKYFLNLLTGNEIVVLDNYYFTTEFQKKVKDKGCKLVCIDDAHDKHFVADIIINHAEGVAKSDYSSEKYTKFCLGFNYALLRKEYLSNISYESLKQYSCLIMMGGTDPFNLAAKLVSIMDPASFQLPIAIIIGADYKHESMFNSFSNIELFRGLESSGVFLLMQKSLFGILPASTVAVEACAARLPFVCGFIVDNQKEIYSGIKNNNLAICIDNFLGIDDNVIIKAINKINNKLIRDKIISNQISSLDKKSKERFIKIFSEL